MKHGLIFALMIAIILISGCIGPGPSTTTTIGQCQEYGDSCESTFDCCEGLYCTEGYCWARSCGDGICQYELEDVDFCPVDCSPKTSIISIACKQGDNKATIIYTSKNINNDSFIEKPSYEIWSSQSLNNLCVPDGGKGCLVYRTGPGDYYEIELNGIHEGSVADIDLIQPNSKYPYYNAVPENYWLRLCLSSFNIAGNASYKGSANCTFIANTECEIIS